MGWREADENDGLDAADRARRVGRRAMMTALQVGAKGKRNTNTNSPYELGLYKAGDMLAKLRRELDRAADASFSRHDLIDHAAQMAVENRCSALRKKKPRDRFLECLEQLCLDDVRP